MIRLLSILACMLASCGFAGKPGSSAGYQPVEGDILFQSLPNPAGLDLIDAIEGSTGSP